MTHRFEVWAPAATAVEVAVDGARHAMTPDDRAGWWSASVDAAAGSRYGFALDGGPVLPDPRSPSQPDGVHGLSAVVDHETFSWTDESWRGSELRDAVIYELHIGTFTSDGTFDAAIERLDDLVALGVTAIELLPVVEFPGERGWGYDGVDLFAPHHTYGGPDGLKRLVDACHARELNVIIDVVYNHLGPDGNNLGAFGPYFTDVFATPWGAAVSYGQRGSDEVRAFVIDNALMWLRDYHADGLRLDAVHAILDLSATHVLEELASAVRAFEAESGRTCWVIAESDLNDPRIVREVDRGGYGLDAQWSDDFHHALHVAATGERDGYYADFVGLPDVVHALERAFVYVGQHAPHRGRRHGRAPEGIDAHRFLGYVQNHDQVGNRAAGDRLSHLTDVERVKVVAAVVVLSPFVPMLFQGEEWAASTPFQYFTDHRDAELAEAVRTGRRNEFASFGWKPEDVPDPQALDTFNRSKLVWDERAREPHASILAWHRALIALRRTHTDLSAGGFADLTADVVEDDVLVVRRGSLTLVAAFGDGSRKVDVHAGGEVVLASGPVTTERGIVALEGPRAVVIAPQIRRF